MQIKDLLQEVEELKNPQPQGNLKDKLHAKMKDLYSILEDYENSGQIRESDSEKIEVFKGYVKHFIDEENKKHDI